MSHAFLYSCKNINILKLFRIIFTHAITTTKNLPKRTQVFFWFILAVA